MLRRLAPVLFIASGVAGLLLQVAWFRLLSLSLGGTLAAATVVLSAFMAGLAAGAWATGRWAPRARSPLAAYGWLELGAAIMAAASLVLLPAIDRAYPAIAHVVAAPGARLAIKACLAAAVLVPPTFFMGGTLPMLCQALVRRADSSGSSTGALYALNTVGAVAGTLLAIFVVVPAWGLSACVLLGAGIDVAIALAVGALSRGARDEPSTGVPAAPPLAAGILPRPAGARALAAVLFVTGAAGVAYEVLWTRALAFTFGSGAHAFAVVVAVVLAGLALGAFVGGSLADRARSPALVLAASQALMGVAIAWQVWRFPALPDFLYDLASRASGRISFTELSALMLLGAVQVLLPASVLMGAALPVAVRMLSAPPTAGTAGLGDTGAGAIVGRLASANALGTILGAVLAAWVLVPWLGLQRALVAVGAMGVAVAVAVAARFLRRGALAAAVALAVVGAACLGVAWHADPHRIYAGTGGFVDERGESTLLRMEESAHGTVTLTRVKDDRGAWLSLSVDAVNVAGTSPPLLSCQTLQGQLPLLLHGAPKRVLHIGFGSGGTAAAVATHAGVERIDVAEINPAVLSLSGRELRAVNEGVLDDPRVRVHLEDGRNYLLGTTDSFDCILSDSVHPRYRGNASLYTVEYFQLCRSRLRPGGLVSTWLPIYSLSEDSLRSIVASMRAVFPATSVWYLDSTVNEFVIVIGRDEPGIDVAALRRAFAEPAVAASLERVGVRSVVDLLDFHVAQGPELDALVGRVRLHRDDLPWVELESATVLDRDVSWRVNLSHVVAARRSVVPHLVGADAALVGEVRRREAATSEELLGQLALLARDGAGARGLFAEAARLDPTSREPWEVFGTPPWVHAFALAATTARAPGAASASPVR